MVHFQGLDLLVGIISHLVGWVIMAVGWLLFELVHWVVMTGHRFLWGSLIYIVNGILKGVALYCLNSLVGVTWRGFKPADSLDTVVYGIEHHSLSKEWINRLGLAIFTFKVKLIKLIDDKVNGLNQGVSVVRIV